MMLRAGPTALSFPLLKSNTPSGVENVVNNNVSVPLFSSSVKHGGNVNPGLVVCAMKSGNSRPLTGVVFEPFEEVKKELDLVPTVPQVSLARHKYCDDCEAAINEQIK